MSRSATSNPRSNLQSTPSSRVKEKSGLDERSKNRVRNAHPNGSRCLIENCLEIKAVEFCHCFPRYMSYERNRGVLDRIEWYWNMQHHTLNLDTRRNIFRAGASMHYLFDQNHWLLLPEQNIIDDYYNSLRIVGESVYAFRELFPRTYESQNVFYYHFLPISRKMVDVPLMRQNDAASLTVDDISIHLHPFFSLPVLESHLHPKFAILEAGRKLVVRDNADVQDYLNNTLPQFRNAFKQIKTLYFAWTAALPDSAETDQSFNYKIDPDDESNRGDDRSDRTASRRVQDPDARKRPRQGGSPTPAPKHAGRSQQTLKQAPSLEPLGLHNDEAEKQWTDDAVRDWSKHCHPLPESIHAPWNSTQICV